MEIFLSALGLLLIFEGLPYFIVPDEMKKMAELMTRVASKSLRIGGFALMVTGLVILYVIHGF